MNCPASVGLSIGIPESPPSKWAKDGTGAHELGEEVTRDWLKNNRTLTVEQWGEWIKRCGDCFQAVYDYINLIGEELAFFIGEPSILLEKCLHLDESLKMFGTLDFMATGEIMPGQYRGLIIDFKYGKGVQVTAEDNWQLKYYAAMLVKNSSKPLDSVKCIICQPRAEIKKSEVMYSRNLLEIAERELIDGAKRAMYQAATKEYTYQAGDHCRWCPIKRHCIPRAVMDIKARENQ